MVRRKDSTAQLVSEDEDGAALRRANSSQLLGATPAWISALTQLLTERGPLALSEFFTAELRRTLPPAAWASYLLTAGIPPGGAPGSCRVTFTMEDEGCAMMTMQSVRVAVTIQVALREAGVSGVYVISRSEVTQP